MPSHDISWRDSIVRLGHALQVPDLRKRLLFIAAMFALFVAGLHIPAPFVDAKKIEDLFASGALGLLDIMSGGGFKRLSILALGIVPYINASIIMQLLGIAVPSIQRLQKEGETGRKVISSYTRWGTVILAFFQATGLGIYLYKIGAVEPGLGVYGIIPLVIIMAAGTSFLMWMGEQLTDRGIGNGVSLIIFAGILISMPVTFQQMIKLVLARNDDLMSRLVSIGLIVVIFLAIVVFITWVHQATRQIPIQHAKRVVGNRVFSSANTYLPLKIATAGVIPIIFAISVAMLPGTIAGMLMNSDPTTYTVKHPVIYWLTLFSPGAWLGGIVYFLLVVFFTYFYTAVVYNVQDIADNLKKHGSFVPGLRPGKQTEKYIDHVLTRLTFAGALFLGIVALLPYIIPVVLQMGNAGSQFLWGGTSLLIVVGVALETMKQMEAHMVMRRYEGFIK
ncbi:MAG: preprotein translocase subunit SecY [Armatimonadota bacterium]